MSENLIMNANQINRNHFKVSGESNSSREPNCETGSSKEQNQQPLFYYFTVSKTTITINELLQIQMKFLKFSLSKPNDCDRNFIDIFAEDTNIPSR